MQIEAGKFYKTRDGRKVGPMRASARADAYVWTDVVEYAVLDRFSRDWRTDGSFHEYQPNHPADLITELSEFKAGDRVHYKDNCVEGFGVIHSKEHDRFDWRVLVENNDRQYAYFDNETTRLFHERDLTHTAATSAIPVSGDIVEVVADRYSAVPVWSLGRGTAPCKEGRHVRMCGTGLSYVFALDEIALSDRRPESEYEAGDSWDDYAVELVDDGLRDDIAIAVLMRVFEDEGVDGRAAHRHAAHAYAYADAMIAARAA